MNDLNKIIMTRKAVGFSHVDTCVMAHDAAIQELPIIDAMTLLGAEDDEALSNDFKIEAPQYFILRGKNGDFLVNTEGYNYARYTARIMRKPIKFV